MSILRARNKKPIINFGNGVVEATINEVTGGAVVCLNTIYNPNFYVATIDEITDLNGEQINASNFVVSSDVVGTYEVRVTVTNIVTSTKLISNKIILNVI
jgi:hypothetical protein